MADTLFQRGARFRYTCTQDPMGSGTFPFVFQHGMGGDLDQPMSFAQSLHARPVISMDARGHGWSDAISVQEDACFDHFADDLIGLMDHLEVQRFVVGGISMGAATALNVALRYPARVAGLVLCRPAWLDEPMDSWRRQIYAELADLLDRHSTEQALQRFESSDMYREVAHDSPAAAASLLHQLTRSHAHENADLLRALPADAPSRDRADWSDIPVDTLVIGHRNDPFHPWSIAETYADVIPDCQHVEVPSKDRNRDGFQKGIEDALASFLTSVGDTA